jgi:hypothetical protein
MQGYFLYSLCFSSHFFISDWLNVKKWLRLLSGQTTLHLCYLQGRVMSQALPLITRQGDRIAIVSGLRTPFARQATAFHGIPAVDLGKMVVGEMLLAAKYLLMLLNNWFSARLSSLKHPTLPARLFWEPG